MNLVSDLIRFIFKSIEQFASIQLYITFAIAAALSTLCFVACNQYTRLWNKGYRSTITHKIFSFVASLFTFIFIIAFSAFSRFGIISAGIVDWWAYNIVNDQVWSNQVFQQAYATVKAQGLETFSDDPHIIPAGNDETQKYLTNFYSTEVCRHFDSTHKFLAKLVWVKPGIALEKVEKDKADFFKNNPNTNYELINSVKIAASIIKEDLLEQTPRVVFISKLLLVLAFIIVQAIPFGLIGWAAYKDLKIKM